MKNTAILLLSCPDRKGIVAGVAQFLYEHNANILHADEHQDSERSLFFLRIEWDMSDFTLKRDEFQNLFSQIAKQFNMDWNVEYSDHKPKLAICVSQEDHCLVDLLYRHQSVELDCEIPLIISNHRSAAPIARFYKIPFHEILITKDTKGDSEQEMMKLLKDKNIEVLVLARYMQILSNDFINSFSNPIINIHHSFLPSFIGSKPYHQAYKRGVKIIGATAHYVTDNLDQGQIIEQDILRVSHRDSVKDLVQKGKDIEKMVLFRAVKWHVEHKILVYSGKTVVFD